MDAMDGFAVQNVASRDGVMGRGDAQNILRVVDGNNGWSIDKVSRKILEGIKKPTQVTVVHQNLADGTSMIAVKVIQ